VRNRISKNCVTTTTVLICYDGNPGEEREKKYLLLLLLLLLFEIIMTENFLQINVRDQTRNPGSSKNTKPWEQKPNLHISTSFSNYRRPKVESQKKLGNNNSNNESLLCREPKIRVI
jgi:hypothetical protein